MSRFPQLQPFGELPAPSGALLSDLARILGPDAISVSPQDRLEASRDMWPRAILWRRKGLYPPAPQAVLYPSHAEDAARIFRWASERGIPVVPVGGRSGVLGGVVALEAGALAVDTRRLADLDPPDRERMEATVGAGVLGADFESMLDREGFTLGHAPASIGGSTVGGWIATRSAGQNSSRYGKIEDMVVELECVLGTGEIVHPARPTPGTDWVELFCGSEGSLGLVTRATFRIWPRPAVSRFRAWRFPRIENALDAMREILQSGARPSVLRLYDPIDTLLSFPPWGEGEGAPRRPPGLRELWPRTPRPVPLRRLWNFALWDPRALNGLARLRRSAVLVLGHEGEAWEVEAEARAAAEVCARSEGKDLGPAPGERWMRHRWESARHFPTVFEMGGWVDTLELAIGWGGVARLYHAVRKAVAPHAFCMAHFSHAYPDGCSIYFTFLGAAEDPDRGLGQHEATWAAALAAARDEGATLSHHHGVGLQKAAWLEQELGDEGMGVLRALRRACDPAGILNPGKFET